MRHCFVWTSGDLVCSKLWSQSRHFNFRKIVVANSKGGEGGEESKPSDNGSKIPKELKVNGDKKIPLPKEVKAIAEKKTTLPKVIPKPLPSVETVKHFTNKQRFVVPSGLETSFRAEWSQREKTMQLSKGFVELKIAPGVISSGGMKEIVVSSEWNSIPEWEAYSCSNDARRSHLPIGIYQYVPKKGEGFPEDFVPFIEYREAVNAKY